MISVHKMWCHWLRLCGRAPCILTCLVLPGAQECRVHGVLLEMLQGDGRLRAAASAAAPCERLASCAARNRRVC